MQFDLRPLIPFATLKVEDVGASPTDKTYNDRKSTTVLPPNYLTTKPNYVKDTAGWARIDVVSPKESCPCHNYDCVKQAFDSAQFQKYKIFGPNSNTFAHALLQHCGMHLLDERFGPDSISYDQKIFGAVWSAVGWTDPPPPYWPPSNN